MIVISSIRLGDWNQKKRLGTEKEPVLYKTPKQLSYEASAQIRQKIRILK